MTNLKETNPPCVFLAPLVFCLSIPFNSITFTPGALDIGTEGHVYIYKGTYLVQTTPSMQTSIWTIGSRSGRGDLQKRDYLIQGRAVNCKITQSPYAPWIGIDPVIQIEVCTEELVCTRYVC